MRFTDADGLRLTAFATNTTGVPIAALELRRRQRARAEDRMRAARATGLRNLPLHDTTQNQIWLEIVQIPVNMWPIHGCSPPAGISMSASATVGARASWTVRPM